jgi:toxin ParE1/3/4
MYSRVEISERAWRDLEEIVRYIARNNPTAAERYGKQLLRAAQSLEQAPLMGVPVKGRDRVRMIVYSPYLIFYRVNTDSTRLDILRFWHGARDPKGLPQDH